VRHARLWVLGFSLVAAIVVACGNSSISQRPTPGTGSGGADGLDGSSLTTGGTFSNGVGGTVLNTGDASNGNGAASSLVFDPPVVTLVLDSPAANKVATYTLTATLRDG